MKKLALRPEQIRAAWDYRDGALYWREQHGSTPAGSRAGAVHSKGYRQVSLRSVLYLEHRLIWVWHHGVDLPPDAEIDHINRDRADNRIENLRLANSSLNKVNTTRAVAKTGYIGVQVNGRGWQARIGSESRTHVIGQFDTREAAAKAYDQEATKRYGKFARLNFA